MNCEVEKRLRLQRVLNRTVPQTDMLFILQTGNYSCNWSIEQPDSTHADTQLEENSIKINVYLFSACNANPFDAEEYKASIAG